MRGLNFLITAAAFVLSIHAAHAQAVCSIPHASPSQPGADWTFAQPPGGGWLQVAAVRHGTTRHFGPDGSLDEFFTGGRALTTTLSATVAAGLVRGVDGLIQIPVHRLAFSHPLGNRERTGFGDVTMRLRLSAGLLGRDGLPVAVRMGLKLPGSSFPIDPDILPLTEGQRDWELGLESGSTIPGTSAHVVGWLGYRWREALAERKPGNELFGYVATGGRYRRLHVGLALEMLRGQAPVRQGLTLVTARRQMLQLAPVVGWQFGPGEVQVGGRLPLTGRNLPGGPVLHAGYVFYWKGRSTAAE
jgi:hypothetical protein